MRHRKRSRETGKVYGGPKDGEAEDTAEPRKRKELGKGITPTKNKIKTKKEKYA